MCYHILGEGVGGEEIPIFFHILGREEERKYYCKSREGGQNKAIILTSVQSKDVQGEVFQLPFHGSLLL